VTPVGGSWLDADTYRIQGNNGFMDVPAENMVIFNGYEPDDDRVGTSPLETLRLVLAEEVEAAQYRAQLWARGARAAMVITRPHDAPDWEDGERNRFLRDWRAQYVGDGPNAGGTPLLEDGMTVAAVGVTPKEAQYVESRKLTREEVSALYHIPAPFIGILDHATFSNIAEQHIQLYVDVMGPWCDEMSQEVNAQVVPDFYPDGLTYCEFNIQEKLAGDFERQATVIQSATGAPWLLRSEARARFNLPFIEGTDVLVTPLNVSGGQQASPNDSAPPAPGAPVDAPVTDPGADPAVPPADNTTGGKARRAAGKAAATEAHKSNLAAVYAKTFVRQQKAVLARYGELSKSRKATGPDAHELFDRARWDRDLSLDLTVPALSLVAEVGQAAAGTLPDASFDDALTPNYVAAQCAGTAAAVNQTTQDQITAALTAPDVEVALAGVFALALASRAAALGAGHAANLAGWATVEAGHQYGGPALKTWNTGPNPRPSHAAMSGQTVPLDGIFSNGARWPADAVSLGIDDVAGCNCSLTITPEGATL
jgi:HK97 family phage portal protein